MARAKKISGKTNLRARGSSRIRPQFRRVPEDRVEPTLEYWVVHVLHWHALLAAVICVLVVGMTVFSKG